VIILKGSPFFLVLAEDAALNELPTRIIPAPPASVPTNSLLERVFFDIFRFFGLVIEIYLTTN
jgi:hypothetical protein